MMNSLNSAVYTLLLFPSLLAASDITEGLIARWTFNDRNSEALIDDINGIPLELRPSDGNNPQIFKPDGTIVLQPEQTLVTSAINSSKYGRLQQGGTIWLRLRIDRVDADHTTFLAGFFTKEQADWKEIALAVLQRPPNFEAGAGLSFYGQVNGGKFGARMEPLPDKVGQFISIALVYDGAGRTITLESEGARTSNRKNEEADRLIPFELFAIGRISRQGAVVLTIDEVRIYAQPLPSDWLQEIQSVPLK